MATRPTTPTPTQQPAAALATTSSPSSLPPSPAIWKEACGYIEKDGAYYALTETLHQQALAEQREAHADELAALEQSHAAALRQAARAGQALAALQHRFAAHKALRAARQTVVGQEAEIAALRRQLAAAEQRAAAVAAEQQQGSAAQEEEEEQQQQQQQEEDRERRQQHAKQLAAANQRTTCAREMGLRYRAWCAEAARGMEEGRQELERVKTALEKERARGDALAALCEQRDRSAEQRSATLECAAQNLRDRLASANEELETARVRIQERVRQCQLHVRMGERRSEDLERAAQNLRDRLAMTTRQLGHQERTITDLRALFLQALGPPEGCQMPPVVLVGYLRRATNLIETRSAELKRLQDLGTSD